MAFRAYMVIRRPLLLFAAEKSVYLLLPKG
jgi:hypothetical protein